MVIKIFKIILIVLFLSFTFAGDTFALTYPISSGSWSLSTNRGCSLLPENVSYQFSNEANHIFKRSTNFTMNVQSQILQGSISEEDLQDYIDYNYSSTVFTDKINSFITRNLFGFSLNFVLSFTHINQHFRVFIHILVYRVECLKYRYVDCVIMSYVKYRLP